QNRQIVKLAHLFFLYVRNQNLVETLESDGLVLENFRDIVSCFVDAWITQDEKDPLRIVIDESHFGFENGHAGALGAHQSSCQIEAAIFSREQLVEIVA